MSGSIKFIYGFTLFACIIVSLHSHPLQGEETPEVELSPQEPNSFKQEDPDAPDEETEVVTTPLGPNFGSQVAQIISGSLTGNLNSILQGSFNLVQDMGVRKNVNSAYETIAGITQTTPAPPTTLPTSTLPTTKAPTEATEAPDEFETDAPVSASTAGTNNEDDDDEEEGAEEQESLGGATGSEFGNGNDEDSSVFTRSKVLRVI